MKFEIDFIELSFLVEACIPPRPIARAAFWEKVINKYYHDMSASERVRLFKWITDNSRFKSELERGNRDCKLFHARFDPKSQFLVTYIMRGVEHSIECFSFNGGYYTASNSCIIPELIQDVRPTDLLGAAGEFDF